MSRDSNGSNGSTRRRFLGGALAGTVATALSGRATGAAEVRDSTQELDIRCSSVHNLNETGAAAVRVDFTDGSYVNSPDGVPDTIGSPGRVVDRVVLGYIDGNDVVEANRDCDPGEPATTFTDSSVFVGASERELTNPQGATSVTLHFADGTTQEVLGHSESTGIGDEGDNEGLSTTYRGDGEHAGKTIEAIRFNMSAFDKRVYLRNRDVGAHLLGKRTSQEHVYEIVGATTGDVEYEFTVDGLVYPVTNIGNPLMADDNDDLTDNGDGTWTVSGFTGNEGYGDSFVVAGVDGWEVTPQEFADG